MFAWRRRGSSLGRGRPQIYSDTAIECALIVRTVFHLSLRATQGFLKSVVRLMDVDLPVPAYSTVCRRQASLEPRLRAATARQPRHVVIDTTGLKVFGAGEWYVRKHGMEETRRRTWRKLHLCVDETTKDIVAVDLTTSSVHDSSHLPTVLDLIEADVGQVTADTAYDSVTCYEAILAGRTWPVVFTPPPWPNRGRERPRMRAVIDSYERVFRTRVKIIWPSGTPIHRVWRCCSSVE